MLTAKANLTAFAIGGMAEVNWIFWEAFYITCLKWQFFGLSVTVLRLTTE